MQSAISGVTSRSTRLNRRIGLARVSLDLAERLSCRGQQVRDRHVERARTERDAVDQAGAAQYAGGKSHARTSEWNVSRCPRTLLRKK
jgi:hypothetical protein